MDSIAKEVSISSKEPIVLKGGGALLLGYGLDRFSNDLDFDATRSPELEKHFDRAAKAANVQIDAVRVRKNTETVKRYKVDCHSIRADGSPGDAFTLKVEISLRNRSINLDHTHLVNGVRVYRLEQLIGQKMGAFEHRSVPRVRDLSDMVFLAERHGSHFTSEQAAKLKSLMEDPDALVQKFGPDHKEDARLANQPLEDMILRLDAAANRIAADLSHGG